MVVRLLLHQQRVVYALSNQIGRWAPRTRLAEVFFNSNGGDVDSSDYAGIYVITDRIEVGEGPRGHRVTLAFRRLRFGGDRRLYPEDRPRRIRTRLAG